MNDSQGSDARSKHFVDVVNSQLDAAVKDIRQLTDRVENLFNRLLGAVPSSDTPAGAPAAVITTLDRFRELDHAIVELRSVLFRSETQ